MRFERHERRDHHVRKRTGVTDDGEKKKKKKYTHEDDPLCPVK
jgi:hypothetical protein